VVTVMSVMFLFVLQVASTAPFLEQAEVTLKTNYWNTLNVCNILFPILRPHARYFVVLVLTQLVRCTDSLYIHYLCLHWVCN